MWVVKLAQTFHRAVTGMKVQQCNYVQYITLDNHAKRQLCYWFMCLLHSLLHHNFTVFSISYKKKKKICYKLVCCVLPAALSQPVYCVSGSFQEVTWHLLAFCACAVIVTQWRTYQSISSLSNIWLKHNSRYEKFHEYTREIPDIIGKWLCIFKIVQFLYNVHFPQTLCRCLVEQDKS